MKPFDLKVGDRLAHKTIPGEALVVATSARPALSWVVPLVRNGQAQTAYRIVATTSSSAQPADDPDAWDSGIIESEENAWIAWGGSPLADGARIRWAVAVRDEDEAWSGWSAAAEIFVPPLTAVDWDATWISVAPTKAAVVEFTAAAPVRAVLHFAAQGLVRVVLDGACVNEGARDPSDAAIARTVSRSYDVTEFLRVPGRHRLQLIGARGHLHALLERVRVIARLDLEFADGTRRRVGTSPEWGEASTTLVDESPFYAEVHDQAHRSDSLPADLTRLNRVRSGAAIDSVGTIGLPAAITPDAGPPIRAIRTIHPVVISQSDDVVVFDLGENVAARSEVTVRGTRPGQRLTIVHGEMLVSGRVSTLNLTLPDDRDRERQSIEWTCGSKHETIAPWFAIHGFRYFEIRGLEGAEIDRVEVRATHSAAERTGTFASSAPLLDRLVDMAVRTQLNNTHAHPEDCPTREQAGWTGDASVSAEAALQHLDMIGVYRNWLRDVVLDQRADGAILGVSPSLLGEEHLQPADPVWGSAMSEIPLRVWQATGDQTFVAEILPAVRRWVAWQLSTLVDGIVRRAEISYGADWLAAEQTPPALLQTAAVDRSLRALAVLESAVGNIAEESTCIEHADRIRAAARREFWDPTLGVWGNGSQASYGIALSTGWVDDAERDVVAQRLTAEVDRRDGRLSSGYAGTQMLVRALGDLDGGHALFDALHQPEEPGVGAMLASGPGTLWETWWTHEPTLGIASLDHIGLAAPIAAWAWTHAAGLRLTDAGYRSFEIRPSLTSRITHCAVTRHTIRGTIELEWTRVADTLKLAVTVPVGSTACIPSPDGDILLAAGRHDVTLPAPVTTPRATPVTPQSMQRLWLGDGRDEGRWSGAPNDLIADRWVCSPVFHEPLAPPIRCATLKELVPGASQGARLDLDRPLDPDGVRFVSALVDLDNGILPGQRVTPFLTIHGEWGTVKTRTTRWLPVAWTRVAVDLGDWPPTESIVAVSVGVTWEDAFDIARGAARTPPPSVEEFPIRIGEVGWSYAPRTW